MKSVCSSFVSDVPVVSPYLTRPLRSREEVLAEREARRREAEVVVRFMPMVTTRGMSRSATASPQFAA